MIELGMQRISRLLAETPLPWRAIHVAGTNGKGSICAYTSSLLGVYNESRYRDHYRQSRLKHGRFTSPHLIDRWDCITIDQEAVSPKLFHHIESQVKTRNERDEIKASEFELLTATAFEIFTHEELDVGVVEVGMGGRLDATNIIGQPVDQAASRIITDIMSFRSPPLVTAISKIGLDHQAFLGSTLPEIAREKAGIMKPGVPVIWDTSNEDDVVRVLDAQAQASASRVVEIGRPHMRTGYFEVHNEALELFADQSAAFAAPKKELAEHQRRNFSVAYRSTWTALQELGRLPVRFDTLPTGDAQQVNELAHTLVVCAGRPVFRVPGRLQVISIKSLTGRRTDVLLDGAHNAQSVEVLAAEASKIRHGLSNEPVTWVIAASDSKDVREILKPLLQNGDSVFTAEFGPVDGMPWVKPTPAAEIARAAREIAQSMGDIKIHEGGEDLLSVLTAASKNAHKCPMIIAGSLYLVGDVLRLLRDKAP